MIGKFHLPISAGGSLPDPSTYCPANGYIPNPINPADGWVLLAEFQTNSPSSATFDPTIAASSGQYAWNLGDGTFLIGDKAISHTYLTTATRTVKLYGKPTYNIQSIDIGSDNIVGAMDISNSAFISVTSWIFSTNALMTSVIFPSSITGTTSAIYISSTGIIGLLDISMFTAFTATAVLQLYANPSMTGVSLPSSITGTFSSIWLYSTGIVGILDLSMFTAFTTNADLSLYLNPSMTGVLFASSITGTFSALNIHSSGIIGALNLSMFTTFTSSASINLYSNPSMTSIVLASSITGTINGIGIYSTGIVGNLDLSKLTSYTATATVYINSNPSMTGITFPTSTITGFIRTLRLYSNTSLGYVDFTKLRTGVVNLNWQFQNNGWSAAIVNHVLVDIDGISAAGFTGRVINIGGTNADPDSTSGGYDGIAARNSLIAKGFTVTIT